MVGIGAHITDQFIFFFSIFLTFVFHESSAHLSATPQGRDSAKYDGLCVRLSTRGCDRSAAAADLSI